MKNLRVLTGISMNLVYHVGRHSFTSLVTLEEGVPIETISNYFIIEIFIYCYTASNQYNSTTMNQ